MAEIVSRHALTDVERPPCEPLRDTATRSQKCSPWHDVDDERVRGWLIQHQPAPRLRGLANPAPHPPLTAPPGCLGGSAPTPRERYQAAVPRYPTAGPAVPTVPTCQQRPERRVRTLGKNMSYPPFETVCQGHRMRPRAKQPNCQQIDGCSHPRHCPTTHTRPREDCGHSHGL